MDPLSLGLAGLALAKALQDILKLAQDISDSLEKVAKNMEKSRRLLSDIVNSLRQLEKVYERYSEVIVTSQDLKDSVDHLKSEMEGVRQKCQDLFQPSPKSRLKRARVAFNAWKNASKVEEEIATLKDHVNTCHIQFTTFAAARIEISTRQIQDQTSRIEITTARIERLVFDNAQVEELKHLEGMINNIDVTAISLNNESARSAISDTYLRFQVDTIDQSLEGLAKGHQTYRVGEPLNDYMQPFKSVIDTRSPREDRETRHREVVKKALDIVHTLQQDSSNLSVQEGAWDMVNLAISLHQLDMFNEAVTIGVWTVNLFRTLVGAEPGIYRPYLALSLLNLARYHLEVTPEKALPTMEECVTLTRSLQDATNSPEIRSQLGRALTTYASMLSSQKEHQKALDASQEALGIFEKILRELRQWGDLFGSPLSPDEAPNNPIPEIPQQISPSIASSGVTYLDSTPRQDSELSGYDRILYDYGRAQIQHSYNLEDMGQLTDAHEVNTKVVQCFRYLCSIYPESILDTDLASALFRLGHSTFRDSVPVAEAITYIEEATALYQKLYNDDPKKYSSNLYDTLWQKATILGTLERYDEAYEAWQQAVDIAKQMLSNQLFLADALVQACWILRRLSRYEDAVILRTESASTYRSAIKEANKYEADAYHDLAVDYQYAERHKEAIQAAQDAITQYRALVFADPEQYTPKLANGVATLSHILLTAGEPETALEKSIEAVKLYEMLILEDTYYIPNYLRTLRIQNSAIFSTDDADKVVPMSLKVIGRLREMAVNYPEQVGWGLADAMEQHGLLLDKLNRLEEAVRWADEVMQWYESLPVNNPEAAEKYLVCLINNASDLDHLGRSEQALIPIKKAVAVGKRFCSANSSVASYTASSMLRYANVLWELGRYSQALVASTDSVAFARSTTVADITEFAGCLVVHSMALNSVGRAPEAVEVAEEAVKICREAPMEKISDKNIFCFLQLPQSLQMLSECLADTGDEERSLVYARQALDESLKLKERDKILPWTFSESPYGDTLHNLALQLLSIGDAEQSLQHLAIAKELQIRRSQTRNGAFTELACALRTMGLAQCFLGRHEDGAATRVEFEDLQKRLKIAFPDIYRRTSVALERDRQRPMWGRLLQKLDLKCHHQEGVTFA